MRLDEDTVEYFKALADDKGIPYQSLINLYLRDCAQSHRDLKMEWQLVISRIPKKESVSSLNSDVQTPIHFSNTTFT
nr:BrnA antitoxin family protein [Marinomonas foliarum]